MCSGMSQSTRLAECLSKDDADAALETVRHQPALLLQVVDTEGGNGPFHMAVLLRAHRSLARLLALSSSFRCASCTRVLAGRGHSTVAA